MDSKNILEFEEILYDESWGKSKKPPFSKQTQAKTGLFNSSPRNDGEQRLCARIFSSNCGKGVLPPNTRITTDQSLSIYHNTSH